MNMKHRLLAVATLMLALASCSKRGADDDAEPDHQASVAVTTQSVRQGVLPEVISAYGVAAPAVDGATSLHVQAEGSVTHLDVTVGTPVRRGQHLLTFSLSPAAVAAYRQAHMAADVANSQREHTLQLFQRHLATNDQLAQADKALEDARSTLEVLRKQQGGKTTVDLTAPSDGIVGAISAAQGDLLQPGAPVLSLTSDSGVVVTVGVEADPQHPVKVGDTASLVPLAGGASVQGVVKRVAGMLDQRTHLQNVDITTEAPVLMGMGYRADIKIGQWSGWLLPRDALVEGGPTRWYVFQLADRKAVEVPVTIMGESATVTVVAGALDAQRPLVMAGNTQLQNGMVVRAAPAESPR